MYKHSSPEALSLASLGRADSKRPDKTCRGLTTAGRACRKPLKHGSLQKYYHLHRDQNPTSRGQLLGAKAATTVMEKNQGNEGRHDHGYNREEAYARDMALLSETGYATPEPSPTKVSPVRKPVPSGEYFPKQRGPRYPSMQLSPPPSIAPPTPPESIHSVTRKPTERSKPKGLIKFGKAIRKLFHPEKRKSTVEYPSPQTSFHRNELPPSRYPQTISPTGFPSTPSALSRQTPPSSPSQKQPHQQHLPPTPERSPPRPGHQASPSGQSAVVSQRKNGVQRSWETMWVPGTDGLGAHIICSGIANQIPLTIEWLSPKLTPVGRQKLLSCMRAPLSAGEEPGYIYIYKISGTLVAVII